MPLFDLQANYEPAGDQPQAIKELVEGIQRGKRAQLLLGVTGSGKTFTMANVIATVERPALVIAHNKTLAAQLYQEFRSFFPHNAVEYFVSYYDYYQPEAYIARSDTYIEKDLSINDRIDALRLSATRSLLERRDVIIVASVSCIYGLGIPEYYSKMKLVVTRGEEKPRDELLFHLVEMHYKRSDYEFERATFRVRGEIIDIFPAYEERLAVRLFCLGDEIEAIETIDPLSGRKIDSLEQITIYPGSHHVTPEEAREGALEKILAELNERCRYFQEKGRLQEGERLRQRSLYDVEMIREMGFCKGIENYSRHFSGRKAGEPPACLLDYFGEDLLLFIDESHQTLPQIRAMAHGDRARKEALIEYGFRLPSAFDNRPLTFPEFHAKLGQRIYVSATPALFELEEVSNCYVEQVVRPTGLLDPSIEIRPAREQVEDCIAEIRRVVVLRERVLVTTLTKKLAEQLTQFLEEIDIRAKYLHSDIDTVERMQIIEDLRRGLFDVLVGINLLREGLDLPEVRFVAILDGDREGFLRSETALIQTCGRAARNENGYVIIYADTITKSIEAAVKTTQSRRAKQKRYNELHAITPKTVVKPIESMIPEGMTSMFNGKKGRGAKKNKLTSSSHITEGELEKKIQEFHDLMVESARSLDYEKAAAYRDLMRECERRRLI